MEAEITGREESYYEVLNCKPTATYDELKQNYQRLIREYHPDKSNSQVLNNKDRFILIDKAWKILRDDRLRKQYDADLLQKDCDNFLIYAELIKNQLVFQLNEESTKYPCRCGSDFIIYRHYLDEDECVIECSECSNCIVIK